MCALYACHVMSGEAEQLFNCCSFCIHLSICIMGRQPMKKIHNCVIKSLGRCFLAREHKFFG